MTSATDPSHSTLKLLALVVLALACRADASPLFENDSVLTIDLAGPLSTVIEKTKDKEEIPFALSVDGLEHLISVRVRGKSRIRVCDFPPLRLTFPDQNLEESVFADQRRLKLVTHCKDSASAQADLLEEYAAYKIFNLISDVGFKVRLVQITYHDTDERMKEQTFVRKGFIIESASELADRVGGKPASVTGVSLTSLNTEQAAAVFVFQYLIGNTDWSLVTADADDACCHNVDILDIGSQRFPVPYDFDLSGLENAPYARPDPAVGNRTVRQRRYRGYCLPGGAITTAINAIVEQKSDILDVLAQLPGLPEKNVESGKKYLSKFFVQAEDVEKLSRSFERSCL